MELMIVAHDVDGLGWCRYRSLPGSPPEGPPLEGHRRGRKWVEIDPGNGHFRGGPGGSGGVILGVILGGSGGVILGVSGGVRRGRK